MGHTIGYSGEELTDIQSEKRITYCYYMHEKYGKQLEFLHDGDVGFDTIGWAYSLKHRQVNLFRLIKETNELLICPTLDAEDWARQVLISARENKKKLTVILPSGKVEVENYLSEDHQLFPVEFFYYHNNKE